VIYTSK